MSLLRSSIPGSGAQPGRTRLVPFSFHGRFQEVRRRRLGSIPAGYLYVCGNRPPLSLRDGTLEASTCMGPPVDESEGEAYG
jgi:hypothetical protein